MIGVYCNIFSLGYPLFPCLGFGLCRTIRQGLNILFQSPRPQSLFAEDKAAMHSVGRYALLHAQDGRTQLDRLASRWAIYSMLQYMMWSDAHCTMVQRTGGSWDRLSSELVHLLHADEKELVCRMF